MAGVTISSAVRSNLLALQNTAVQQGIVQNRLATGKKVNSALDNPTNFFTAASLNTRAASLSSLLDSVSNGVKTIEAADNGVKAITKSIETLQANIRSARQDKSFKGESLTLASSRTGNISFSGGAIGTSPVNVDVTSGGAVTPTTLTAAGAPGSAVTSGNVTINGTSVAIRGDVTAAATTLTGASGFSSTFTGGTVYANGSAVNVRGDSAATATTLNGSSGTFGTYTGGEIFIDGQSVTIADDSAVGTVQTAIDGVLGSGYTVGQSGGQLTLAKADGTDIAINGNSALLTTIGFGTGNRSSTNGVEAFTATVSTVQQDFNTAAVANLSVSVSGGQLGLSLSTGADLTLTGPSGTLAGIGFGSGNRSSTNGTEAFDATAATIVADITAAGITGVTASVSSGAVSLSLASGLGLTVGGDDTRLTAIGFSAGANRSSNNGVVGGQTVDSAVSAINGNSSLTGKIRATNDGGKLRIENLSTEALTIGGVDGTTGEVVGTGGASTKTVGGNDVRKNLITQFNEIRTQLDKLAGDSSFNGINLLKADKLKLTFNESGTSNLEIQAKNVAGTVRPIDTSSGSLDIAVATAAEFGDDTQLDARLDKLSGSLTTLQTQSSTFGAALSITQNRQDFTKNLINTLQSGADSLVNADINEEGATLLALNTRQQLSQTALSLASQADQSVLRLF